MSKKQEKDYKLNTQQQMAAAMLGRGIPAVDVAKEVGVTPKAICSWKKIAGFTEQIDLVSKEYFGLKVRTLDEQMNSLELKSMNVLHSMLDEDKPDNIKLKAIELILKHQNARKTGGEGQILVNFNMPEPGMPDAESVEEGDTTQGE